MKPCSMRYLALTGCTSMKFSASFAARITRVSLAAMSRATRSAASSRSARGTTSCTEPKWCSVCGVDGRGGEEQPAHQVLRHQAGQVGGRAERAALDLGQAERGVVGGDDDVGSCRPGRCRRRRRSR